MLLLLHEPIFIHEQWQFKVTAAGLLSFRTAHTDVKICAHFCEIADCKNSINFTCECGVVVVAANGNKKIDFN